MESHNVTRPARSHTDSQPLPTDSMVTVSLSSETSEQEHYQYRSLESELVMPESSSDTEDEEEDAEDEGDTKTRPSSFELMRGSFTQDAVKQLPSQTEIQSSADATPAAERSRSNSSAASEKDVQVDWEGLDKTEEQEPRDEVSDEQISLLLARLEQENNALAHNPKSGIKATRQRQSRPPSMSQLKRMVQAQDGTSYRVSQLPSPPPMTELDFWAALVRDYPQTAQRLPTLTANKVRGGIPEPLRGVVWVSMAGARDLTVEDKFEEFCGMSSPYENIINKDIGRSFPGVEMFRDPEGEGQKMLGRVLKCFSLYDDKIGYCQGLGFLVGPLLMHMGEKEAFCVLVRLMEDYDLRSCFLPDLSGLHLRIYQFKALLSQHLPKIATHLDHLQIDAAYLSQWFLSFFAVTCPLPMLFRIYDMIFAEGASETIMRVALSIMRRNEKKILTSWEFEDVMHLLLSRQMWDPYGYGPTSADELVNDFVSFTSVVTKDKLQALEKSFRDAENDGTGAKLSFLPDVQAAASRFLGRLWAPAPARPQTLTPGGLVRPVSLLRRTTSKNSLASSINSPASPSSPSTTAHNSSTSTYATTISRDSNGDTASIKSRITMSKDRDLHGQIEDLLTALSEMQRAHALLAAQLQREREERDEDRQAVHALVTRLKALPVEDTQPASPKTEAIRQSLPTKLDTNAASAETSSALKVSDLHDIADSLANRFKSDYEATSNLETRASLLESLARAREQTSHEASRVIDLERQLHESQSETREARDTLRELRQRVQDGFRERQHLENTIAELKSRKGSVTSLNDTASPSSSRPSGNLGLRELRLGRAQTSNGSPKEEQRPPLNKRASFFIPLSSGNTSPKEELPRPAFAKRASSLVAKDILATENHAPPENEALLLELVNAKTAEAVARQELEELKAKFEALRKQASAGAPSVGHRPTPSSSSSFSVFTSVTSASAVKMEEKKSMPPPANSGSWGWGWGKRSVSTSNVDGGS